MTENEPQRTVYHLSKEHGWTDLFDIHPQVPTVPGDLRPVYITSDPVDEVDELAVYGFTTPPEFMEDCEAIEATRDEHTEWLHASEKLAEEQKAFVRAIKDAAAQYERAVEAALTKLRAGVDRYRPVEAALEARSTELAVALHQQREAANAEREKEEAAREAALDARFGPRVLVLYPPISLDSPKATDHVAKVHLLSCKRRSPASEVAVRAKDAVERLSDPEKWPRNEGYNGGSYKGRYKLQVKLCSSCKPWTVMMEHAEVTFRDGTINLVEWPKNMP